MKYEIIKYYDLERQDGWIPIDEIENKLTPIYAIGVVVAEDDQFLTLTMSTAETEVLFLFTIFKPCILARYEFNYEP